MRDKQKKSKDTNASNGFGTCLGTERSAFYPLLQVVLVWPLTRKAGLRKSKVNYTKSTNSTLQQHPYKNLGSHIV